MRFEPQGEPSHTFEIKIPKSQLNHYRAGGLLRHKRYKVSVRSYNLNGKGVSNDSAVAWAWTQEDGKTPYAEYLISVCSGHLFVSTLSSTNDAFPILVIIFGSCMLPFLVIICLRSFL